MLVSQETRVRILAAGFVVAAVMLLSESACAGTISVPWSTTSFDVSGDSKAGFNSGLVSLPASFTVTHADPDSASGGSLPIPGTGDVTTYVTRSGSGYWDEARTSLGQVSGDPAGTITMRVAAYAYTSLADTYVNKTEAATATAEATFVGEFTSTGTSLDFDFDGRYDRSNFGNQSLGIVPEMGLFKVFHKHDLQVRVKVEDTDTLSTLFDEIVFARNSTYRPVSETNITFSDNNSADLSGTLGHTLAVTVTATALVQDFVQNYYFSDPAPAVNAGAYASSEASIDMLNVAFTTTPVPEPSILVLAASGLLGLALCRRRWKRR